jgi:hypothetical protein
MPIYTPHRTLDLTAAAAAARRLNTCDGDKPPVADWLLSVGRFLKLADILYNNWVTTATLYSTGPLARRINVLETTNPFTLELHDWLLFSK